MQQTRQNAVGHQLLIGHHLRTVESWQYIHEKLTRRWKITNDQTVNPFIHFKFIFSFPIPAFFEKTIAFINVFLDFDTVLISQIDADESEGYVHFFSNFDGAFEGEIEGFDGFGIFMIVIVEFCLL